MAQQKVTNQELQLTGLSIPGTATVSANLSFTGTGNRITGDFSNGTISNGVVVQTSTTNSATSLAVAPNGSSVISGFFAVSGLTADESLAQFRMVGGNDMRLNSTRTGTGTYLPLTMYTGGSERLRIDTSGNVGIGTSSPAALLDIAGGIQRLRATGSSTDTFLRLQNDVGTQVNLGIGSSASSSPANSFYVETNAGKSLVIDAAGNVGIGTTGPSAKLDVRGSSTFLVNATNPTAWVSVDSALTTGSVYTQYNTTASAGIWGTYTNHPVYFVTNNTERMRIDSSGNVGIATTTTTRARLNIVTDGSNTSAGYGLALTNAAGGGSTWTLQCGDFAVNNGAFTIRETGISGTTWFKIESTNGYVTAQGVYNLTTGSASNVFVGTGGDLRRSTSSLKYKKDVQDATHGLNEVLRLRSVTYKGKNDGDMVFGGLIAEEVDAIGLKEFVQYAEDGSPDALAYGNMVSLLAKAIQELKAELDSVKSELNTLKNSN